MRSLLCFHFFSLIGSVVREHLPTGFPWYIQFSGCTLNLWLNGEMSSLSLWLHLTIGKRQLLSWRTLQWCCLLEESATITATGISIPLLVSEELGRKEYSTKFLGLNQHPVSNMRYQHRSWGDPGLWATLRSQRKAPIQQNFRSKQMFRALLRLLFAVFALTLRGTCECSRLLDREVFLGPRTARGWKQNRLGNLKIRRTTGVCSQQSFSQNLPPLPHGTSLLKRPEKKKKIPRSCQPGWLLAELWQVCSICKSEQVSPLSWRHIIIKIIPIATPVTIAYNLWVFALSWHSPDWQNKACMCDKFSVRNSSLISTGCHESEWLSDLSKAQSRFSVSGLQSYSITNVIKFTNIT